MLESVFVSFCKKNWSIVAFPGGSVVKNLPTNAGVARDVCWIPQSGRLPGEGNDNPLQYSCLGNPIDREAWRASPWHHKRVGHNLATKQ